MSRATASFSPSSSPTCSTTRLPTRVLQRFVRLDASRTGGGGGLGLSLVAGVASLHRAELALDESRLGGLRVTLTFPPPAA